VVGKQAEAREGAARVNAAVQHSEAAEQRAAMRKRAEQASTRVFTLSPATYYEGLERLILKTPKTDLLELFDEELIDRVQTGHEKLVDVVGEKDENGPKFNAVFEGGYGKAKPFAIYLGRDTKTSDTSYELQWVEKAHDYVNVEVPRPQYSHRSLANSRAFLTAFGNDIFLDEYFQLHALDAGATRKTMESQPWLRWDEPTESYCLERGTCQQALLAKLFAEQDGPNVKLYRGLSQKAEVYTRHVLQKLKSPEPLGHPQELANEWRAAFDDWYTYARDRNINRNLPTIDDWQRSRNEYKQFAPFTDELLKSLKTRLQPRYEELAKAIEKNPKSAASRHKLLGMAEDLDRETQTFLHRNATFFSADSERSEKFTKQSHRLLTVTMPKELLAEMARREEIYVGIERSMEIGMHSSRARQYCNEHGKITVVAPEKGTGA